MQDIFQHIVRTSGYHAHTWNVLVSMACNTA